MNRRSSLVHELRDHQKDQGSRPLLHQFSAGLGIVTSIAFLMMILFEKPGLGLLIAALATIFLAGRFIYRSRSKSAKKTPLKFSALHTHRIGPSAAWMKATHLGHSDAIDQLVSGLDRDLSLASPRRILGAHLVLGPSGTGKTQLAQLLSQTLFGKKCVIEFDFRNLDERNFAEHFVEMLHLVQNHPYQLILLDHVDTAPPAMLEPFLEIFRTNEWRQKSETTGTSFSGCFFLAMANVGNLPEELNTDPKKRNWLDQNQVVDERLVSFCSEIISWGTLPNSILAEIACRHIIEHWLHQAIELDYLTPEVILSILKDSKTKAHLGANAFAPLIRNKSASALEKSIRTQISKAILDVDADGFFTVTESKEQKRLRRAS